MIRFLILGFLFVGLVWTQERSLEDYLKEAKRKGEILLNFQGTDIDKLALFMGELIGKNVVVDPAVRGKVTLVFSRPLKLREAWEVFTLALSVQGIGVVEGEKVVAILPPAEAVPAAEQKSEPAEGELALLLFNLRFSDAQSALNTIRPFLSPFAKVAVHSGSNTLVIVDTGASLRKVRSILSAIDLEESAGEVRVYKLRYLSPREAAKVISSLNAVAGKRFGIPPVVSPSEEAGAVVVFAPRKFHETVSNILSQIDTERVEEEQRNFYVIPLKFVSAEALSETLQSLLSGSKVRTKPPKKAPSPKQPYKGGTRKGKVKKSPSPKPQPSAFIVTDGGMKIGFDRGTNSVLLYATYSEYEGIKRLIEKLDVRKRQVLIAATVVEASTRKLLDIGVRWQVLGKRGGASFRGTSLTDVYGAFLSGNFLMGVLSETGRTITLGGTSVLFPDLVFLFSLLESGTGFNIVSNPRVLTLDNEPAVIKVGQVVPYAEGVKFDINGQPIITYDYREVGLELNVTPRISGENLSLSIELTLEEIIDFVTNQIGATSYTVPVTSNRVLSSDVVVENGQTVVLGGLVSTKTLRTMEGVPGLWRIPVLGRLFRRDVHQEDKTSLFIFITPYVVSSPEELSRITQEHKRLSEEIRKRIEEREEQEEDEEDFYF